MADFIAKLGLDAKDFVAGLETAAQKAGVVTKALQDSADDSKGLASGLNDAGKAADGLVDSTGKIEDNLSKAGSGGGALDGLTAKFKEGQAAASSGGGMFGEVANKLGQLATPAGAATAAIGGLTAGIAASIAIGQEFQQNLAGVSAITGVTGAGLDDIGNRARDLAKKFGGEASTQLQSFQGILSKFGAQLAETPDQLGTVSENINILAKAGGIDAAGAMDSLTASMLQFGVDTSDANALASESGRFINVLAASAKVGAAEIPQVAEAVKVAGVAAKGAKVSFEETNAAIQVLAAGGKVGSEAGIALRNVLGKIAGEEVIPKPALEKLKSLGVDMSVVSNTSLSLSDRLKELSKASGDATAFAQVFGTENAAAANILANGAQTVQDWAKEITGTDEATKQAATNMNTFSGQIDRAKSAVQDIAIGAFQILAPIMSAVMKTAMDLASIVGTVLVGAFNIITAPITFIVEKLGGFQAVMNALSPVITVVTAAIGGYLLATNASAISTGIVTAAKTAYAAITTTLGSGLGITTAAQWALNAAMEANPIGLVVAAIAALAAGVYLAYQNIEPFRNAVDKLWQMIKNSAVAAFDAFTNAIKVAWEWIKQAIGIVFDLYMKFNPLVILFRTAYDNLGFFRTAVDAVVNSIKAMIKFITDAYDAVVKFFSATNQEVKVTAKVETKVEPPKAEAPKTEAPKEEDPKVTPKASKAADDADKKAAEASKKLLDEKKNLFETEKSILENQSQQTVEAIQQKAIAENRKLTQSEQADILREEIALIEKITEARRKAFDITGEGRDTKTGLKLTAKDAQDIQDSVRDAATKASEAEYKLRFQIVNIGEAQVKEQVAWVARTAKSTEEELKKDLTVEFFTGINEAEATTKIAEAVQKLKDKAAQAAALGDEEAAAKITAQARELEDKLTENAKKGNEKRLKDAEENRKKDLQLKLEAIDNERARALAKQIIELSEKKREVLASDRGTAEERLKIAARYQREIDELSKGEDKSAQQDRAKFAREEADLIKQLNAKKISYEQYNAAILDLEKRKSELEKQIAENQKAAKDAADAAAAAYGEKARESVSEGTAVTLNLKGLNIIKDEALETFLAVIKSGKDAKEALKETMKTINDDIIATFDVVEGKAKKFLDFKRFGILDNAERLGTVLAASFARSEASGKSFKESSEDAVKSAQVAIDGALQKRLKGETEAYDKAKEAGKASYKEVGDIALTTFAIQINEGKNAVKAAKEVALQAAMQLLDIYAIPAIAGFLAFLGPFALPIATAAITLLKGQLSSLAGGFQDGGYTGNGGTSDVAGVVHGQEFVHTADVTRRYRPLFEHLHKGGELSTWAIGVTGQLQTQNQPQPFVSTYGIETRLERLETAIVKGNRKFESMRAVQMTVEHDPSIIIKTQNRNLAIRSARA